MRIKLLLCALSVITPIEPQEPRPMNLYPMYFDVIGPFETNCDDYLLQGYYKALGLQSSLRERIVLEAKDGEYVHSYTTKAHNVSHGETVDMSFNLPLNSMLSSSGIHGKIMILNSSSTALNTIEFNLKPAPRTKINVKDYINDYYQSPDVVVDIDDYEKKHIEQFKFDGFVDYFNTDSYYRIDINDLSMTYSSPKAFTPCRGSLEFVDYNKVFPFLDNQEPVPSFNIPVIAEENEGKISFRFENTMYVNPQTLDMSLIARPGFQLTKYFYLPVNKSEELLDQVFTLKMEEFAQSHVSFDWDIRYVNDRNLIGDCSNSDYCVQGEIV